MATKKTKTPPPDPTPLQAAMTALENLTPATLDHTLTSDSVVRAMQALAKATDPTTVSSKGLTQHTTPIQKSFQAYIALYAEKRSQPNA